MQAFPHIWRSLAAAALSGLLLVGSSWWAVHLATDAHHADVPHCDAGDSLHLHDTTYAAAECLLSAFVWSPFVGAEGVTVSVVSSLPATRSYFGESQWLASVLPQSVACRAPPLA